MKKLLGLVAAVGTLCLAPAIASANTINFDFTNDGTLAKDGCGPACYTIQASGTATDDSDGVAGTSSWTFSGYMTFFGVAVPQLLDLSGITDPTKPAGWSFVDDSGSNNNLTGTFFWALLDGSGDAFYKITGGSGLFAGATGGGSSVISITKWFSGLPEFHEVGSMTVHPTPTSVPEPSLTGLVATGLMMLGFAAYRRRRADVTRS